MYSGIICRYALDISNVLSCRMRFLLLGLDYLDARVFVFVFFIIMCTQRATVAQTLALYTLVLDIEELLYKT